MKKKVLILGSNGLLGQSLVNRFSESYQVFKASVEHEDYIPASGYSYRSTDIVNRSKVIRFLDQIRPDIIINAAAYTNVDKCELEEEVCWNANVKAVENIIEGAERFQPLIVQISTDYVFDGEMGGYREIDDPNPRGIYARSKYAAENMIRACDLEYLIIRTQVLYGTGNKVRNNFVSWVIGELRNGNQIQVVGDQIGNPTYVDDVSEAIARLLQMNEFGLFHVSGSEIISRYNFAVKIAEQFGLDAQKIDKIKTGDLNQKAPRPMNSSFVLDKLVNRTGWEPGGVDAGLEKLKRKYNEQNG